MKVYVLLKWWEGDGEILLGIFDSVEKARKAKDKEEARFPVDGEWSGLEVQEVEVQ